MVKHICILLAMTLTDADGLFTLNNKQQEAKAKVQDK